MLTRKEIRALAEEIVRLQRQDEPFLTIKEAAAYLGVSVSFLEQHPEIPHHKVYPEGAGGDGKRKKAIRRYQKHLLSAYMRGESY